MAQRVLYFEDNVEYKEGPFVYTDINGFRIEVELKGHHCPVLLHHSLYQVLSRYGLYNGKTNNEEKVKLAVDWLNLHVGTNIILVGNEWQWKN